MGITMFKIDQVPKYIITIDDEEPVLLEKEQLQHIVDQYDAAIKREKAGQPFNDVVNGKTISFYSDIYIPFTTEPFPAQFEFFDLEEEFVVALEVTSEDLPSFITQLRNMLADDRD